MEARLGLALVARTTRRMSLTPEDARLLASARRILAEVHELARQLVGSQAQARGPLRVNATLGFGRSQVGPAVSRFAREQPQVEVQLQLSVHPPPLSDDSWDVNIRFGPPPDARVMARLLACNRRLLCASPAYLGEFGEPKTPADLARLRCIGIRQGDEAFGLWRMARGRETPGDAVKTRGMLGTNDGEIAVGWALDGHGNLMRAEWDIARYLASGRLVPVLSAYHTPDADIYAVWPQRLQLSARVRSFVDFLAGSFA